MIRSNNMREGGKNTSQYIKQKNTLITSKTRQIKRHWIAATSVTSISTKKTSNVVLCVKREASITVCIIYR